MGRAKTNVDALEVLRRVRDEGDAVLDERDWRALASYSGWGGAADAFRESFPDSMREWERVNARLRGLLSDDEYVDARASVLTAFYTPRPVIDAMLGMASAAGFGMDPEHPDMVLEPGCGTGNFMRCVPDGAHYRFMGVECDAVSSRIAGLLLPDASIVTAGLERCMIPSGSFDMVVGNVPYSDHITIHDPDSKRDLSIHDYFITRAIDAVRPGGLVSVLTSRYSMDKHDASVRRMWAGRAELIGFVRLPEETFRRQANTDVVTDLLVFRRLDRDEPGREAPWTETVEMAPGVTVNAAVASQPEDIVVGDLKVVSGRFGPTLGVTSGLDDEAIGRATAGLLAAQIGPLGDLHAALGPRAAVPEVARVPEHPAVFEYFTDGTGRVWFGDGGTAVPVRSSDPARMAAMVRLRDHAADLMRLERDPDARDGDVAGAIKALDSEYEGFVARYGRLCDRRNRQEFSRQEYRDVSLHRLWGLELTDAQGRFAGKADMLSRRVITPIPPMPDRAETAQDALAVSLDRTGRVDMTLIRHLLGDCDEEWAAGQLDGQVLRDPDTGEWTLADEWLSGDIGAKLDHVDDLIARESARHDGAMLDLWRRRLGFDDLERSPAGADGRRSLAAAGVWESAVDPMRAGRYVDVAAHVERLRPWDHDDLPALLCLFIRDLRHGAQLTVADESGTRPAATPEGALFAFLAQGALRERFGRETEPANSPERSLLSLVSADPSKAGDEALELALRSADPQLLTCLDRIVPDHESYFSTTRGYNGNVFVSFRDRDSAAALAARLGREPAIAEYLLHTRIELAATAPDRKPVDVVTADGYREFLEERGRYFRENPDQVADTDAGRLGMLRDLKARLESRMPAPLGRDEIAVTLGSSWVPSRIIHEFVTETFDLRTVNTATGMRKLSVSHSGQTGSWQVKAAGVTVPPDAQAKYGTPERTPFEIVQAALNASEMEVRKPDPDDPEGKRKVKDPEATANAWQKRHAVEQAFEQWVWKDPERAGLLAGLYNRRFNRQSPRGYDGSYLTLPGSNANIVLRPHQKDAVARILQSPEGTLIAHVVGAGKTFTGVAACHEMKRLGRATKPMIVVPNHLVEQWASDYMTLYPDAKVIFMDERDRSSAERVRGFWSRVASGDWDAVIVGHSRFSQLGVSAGVRERYFHDRLQEMEESIKAAREEGNDFTVKELEGNRKRLEKRLDDLRGKRDTLDGISFDDLGVDALVVDEAHQFKNLAVSGGLSVAGMSVAASRKCEDLLDKCRLLREQGHGANIVFETGTPVSNTMAEMYNMFRYLAPGLLDEQGVGAFTSWAQTFGQITESVEVNPEGSGFQVKRRFARFHNLVELRNTFARIADVLTQDQVRLDVPECRVVPVAVEPCERQRDEIAVLADRARDVRDGMVDPSVDNMLRITGDGRKIALDPKLLDPDDPAAEPLEDGKVQVCAERIAAIRIEHDSDKAAQLVFCDSSTNASGRWNIYQDLKDRLVRLGVPADEIRFAEDREPRDVIFDKVRRGEVRVLIGSTQKLGTGTNVQDRLIAIHDLDCPWRPADLEQRLGRIQRQGNMFDRVYDYRYVTKGTFDAYMFQTVERKQRFISQVFTSGSPAREANDLDETVLSFAEIKALATGDPNIARRMQIENEIRNLQIARRGFAAGRVAMQQRIDREYLPMVETLTREAEDLEADDPLFQKAAALPVSITVDGKRYADGPDAVHALRAAGKGLLTDHPTVVGTYRGVDVYLELRSDEWDSKRQSYTGGLYAGLMGAKPHPASRPFPMANSGPSTVYRQLDRIIDQNHTSLEQVRERLAKAQDLLSKASAAANAPWDRQEEYDRLKTELKNFDAGNGIPSEDPEAIHVTNPPDDSALRNPADPSDPMNLAMTGMDQSGLIL